jgi:hypothetical protein
MLQIVKFILNFFTEYFPLHSTAKSIVLFYSLTVGYPVNVCSNLVSASRAYRSSLPNILSNSIRKYTLYILKFLRREMSA